LGQTDLLVAEHKRVFFAAHWANYDDAKPLLADPSLIDLHQVIVMPRLTIAKTLFRWGVMPISAARSPFPSARCGQAVYGKPDLDLQSQAPPVIIGDSQA
jgi:hypothetical protein